MALESLLDSREVVKLRSFQNVVAIPHPIAAIKENPVLPEDIRDRLIVALDFADPEEAKKLVRCLSGLVSTFKVGIELQLAGGLELLSWLKGEKRKIFLDAKWLDIPETVKRAVQQAVNLGVSFLTVHDSNKTIEAAVQASRGSEMKILTVTVLTAYDADTIDQLLTLEDIRDLGLKPTVEELVVRRAMNAFKAGCDGVIASALEAKKIKEVTQDQLLVVAPAIREAGAPEDDHKRKATPGEAIRAGADYLVVGRPIRNATDQKAAAQKILDEMEAAWGALADTEKQSR